MSIAESGLNFYAETHRAFESVVPSPAPIPQAMVQMVLDLRASPSLLEVIDTQVASSEPSPFDLGDVERENALYLHHGQYVEFAISMLETCAQDLSRAAKIKARALPTSQAYKNAHQIERDTLDWLNGEDALFTFKDCAELFEQEVRLQSMGQVLVPNVGDRSDELAQWIIADPGLAKYTLSSYRAIFAPRVTDGYAESSRINLDSAGCPSEYDAPLSRPMARERQG